MEKKEIVWIDWAKFICMLLVYWDHVMLYGYNSAPFIIPFRPFFVNAFFFISGYLIFLKQLSPNYIKLDTRAFLKSGFCEHGMIMNIIFKIAIPTIIFAAFGFIPACLVKGEEISIRAFIFDTLIEGGNWFTCALTVSELILFVLLMTRIKNILFYVFIGLMLAIFGVFLQKINYTILGNEHLPWFYKSGIIACAFLSLGGFYRVYEMIFDKFKGLFPVIFLLIAINVDLDCEPMSTWAGINLRGFIISVISIFALIDLCKQLPKFKFIQYISRHTIGFYFLSAAIPFLCIRICDLYIPLGPISFLIQFTLSFALAWLIVFLLEKYLPFIFDLRVLKSKK
ncbi:acyltransferase family protein [uncultured Muribaculum sp.]|uniref:acyltransferase family protein n=3 Tax=uncultured Muribaculum sp. TaxID=1918613 RepID=UPI0025AE3A7F|nr:acyltransferase family protein [uncultured Muribaculum sp.]